MEFIDESCIWEIMDDYRSFAYGAVEDMMLAAFLKIGRLFSDETEIPEEPVHGLSPFVLQKIREHADEGNLEEWLRAGDSGEKAQCLLDFLNVSRLQMKSLRARFPRAYTKWSKEDDAALLDEYRRQSETGLPIRWGELSGRFGRNPNALRLRLEHLGEDLEADASRSRRSGRGR